MLPPIWRDTHWFLPPAATFFSGEGGGGAASFRCTVTKIFLGGFLLVVGGFGRLVASEGPGAGMRQIWSGEIW